MWDYPPEITKRDVGDVENPGVGWVGPPKGLARPVKIVEPDPGWPSWYAAEAARITEALGEAVIRIEHVGSTSVPGLAAKPIIDIDLQVADSDDEDGYVPLLVPRGYHLVLREPWWNGHRMLNDADGRVNLHVFPAGAPEPLRHLLFRDWLRSHPDDRELYASTKRELAGSTAEDPEAYSLAKNTVIDDIYTRIFSVPPTSHPAWPQAH
ncbi:GrpB family protein [Actinospica durhamensis]|uniref:GrpB family protein n=1 Tax=Actinospica durhamensis TaxID=1508375 RepID=A0A941IQ24_9ACTN|nr:GrpB family protein [Actinospica durhamensis]MBR7837180.1 GrpB family protein [Actinospica durhamensis]